MAYSMNEFALSAIAQQVFHLHSPRYSRLACWYGRINAGLALFLRARSVHLGFAASRSQLKGRCSMQLGLPIKPLGRVFVL